MLPILFQLGPITIYSFGLTLGIGFLIAMFTIYRESRKQYIDEEKVFDVVLLTVIGGLIGARLFYIIEHFDNFGFHLLNWLLVNARPGFSLWGGIGVGLAVFLLWVRREKLHVYKLFDLVTVGIIFSFIFGQFGGFLAGLEIGTPTNLPWGVIFFSTLKRHPVSLYSAIASILTLIIIFQLKSFYTKKRIPAGSLFFTFVVLESFLLFWIAFFKEDAIVIGRFFRVDHFVYSVLFLTGTALLYKRVGRSVKSDLIFIKEKLYEKVSR